MRLAADVERAWAPDRLLLALGGRWWLRRRFASTLERLARELHAGEDGRAEPVAASEPARRFGRRAAV